MKLLIVIIKSLNPHLFRDLFCKFSTTPVLWPRRLTRVRLTTNQSLLRMMSPDEPDGGCLVEEWAFPCLVRRNGHIRNHYIRSIVHKHGIAETLFLHAEQHFQIRIGAQYWLLVIFLFCALCPPSVSAVALVLCHRHHPAYNLLEPSQALCGWRLLYHQREEAQGPGRPDPIASEKHFHSLFNSTLSILFFFFIFILCLINSFPKNPKVQPLN